jgi:hypothetical protein
MDLCRSSFDLVQVFRGQFDIHRPDILFQTLHPPGVWDGDNPRLLRQQPGQGNLRQRRSLLFRHSVPPLDEGQVRFVIFRRETR